MTLPNTHKPIGGFPLNPATALLLAMVSIDLQHISTEGPVSDTIRKQAAANPKACIKMVKEMARDAYVETCDVVGWKLVDKIVKLEV